MRHQTWGASLPAAKAGCSVEGRLPGHLDARERPFAIQDLVNHDELPGALDHPAEPLTQSGQHLARDWPMTDLPADQPPARR